MIKYVFYFRNVNGGQSSALISDTSLRRALTQFERVYGQKSNSTLWKVEALLDDVDD